MAKTKKPAPKKGGPAKPAPAKKPMRRKSKRVTALPHVDVTAPKRPTVEEQFDRDAALMQALHDPENQPSQYGTVPMSYLDNQKPSLLRRAWNRVKRVFRYRSAETGLFVSKQHADANPSTTVREKVRK